MLRLTSLGRERAAAGASSVARTRCERFAFGGVAFELLCAQGGSAAALSADELRFCVSGQNADVIADVFCAVHDDPAFVSGQPSYDGVRFREANAAPGALAIEARGFAAELSPLGSKRYAAAARLGPGPDGYAGLLRALATAVLHRRGGLVLQAAALELDGRAVLFVGASGAGKNAALHASATGRCFAYGHVALVPTEGGWFAWGLPGGTPAGVPLAPETVYPLAAVLRVHQAGSAEALVAPRPRFAAAALVAPIPLVAAALGLHRLAGAEALFALRESVEWAGETPAGEEMCLRAATQLSSTVPIGAIATVLGRSTDASSTDASSLRASLRAFLAACGERPS